VARVPWLTAGHSAAGIFCRNVAYWKPHRVIAVIMIKSGNFHRQIDDMDRTLAGVPLILFSGEFEEYGPEGGDLGVGLRSEFSADPTDKAKLNQTQWLMARMQMLDRRRKNPDNLWTLVVHRGHGHTTWDDEMRDLAIQYMRGCVALRVPDTIPDGADEVRCRPVTARDGWLYDADIKTPRHAPAPHDAFAGDRTQAFWAPDRAIAESLAAYHGRGWETPDPTQHWPNERRFTPPDLLKDLVDAPPPVPLPWQGGDGTWAPDTKHWRDGEALMAWDPHRQAVLTTGRVALGADITCAGLRIGNGAMLDASGHQLRSRWHAAFAEDSQLRLTVSGGPDGRADGSLWIEGTTALGGTLLVEPVGPISSRSWPARRRIITCDGVMRGAFARTVLPEGWQLVWEPQKHGGTYGVLLIPKPADAAAR
jgi:hypothetical protein